jgi:hypothetical protein
MEHADIRSEGSNSLEARWAELQHRLESRFGRAIGVDAALFLIGMHARGMGYDPFLPKEAKQDLIMEGGYRVMSLLGLYERLEDGDEPAWRRTCAPPDLTPEEQEALLRRGILAYFDEIFDNP